MWGTEEQNAAPRSAALDTTTPQNITARCPNLTAAAPEMGAEEMHVICSNINNVIYTELGGTIRHKQCDIYNALSYMPQSLRVSESKIIFSHIRSRVSFFIFYLKIYNNHTSWNLKKFITLLEFHTILTYIHTIFIDLYRVMNKDGTQNNL